MFPGNKLCCLLTTFNGFENIERVSKPLNDDIKLGSFDHNKSEIQKYFNFLGCANAKISRKYLPL